MRKNAKLNRLASLIYSNLLPRNFSSRSIRRDNFSAKIIFKLKYEVNRIASVNLTSLIIYVQNHQRITFGI